MENQTNGIVLLKQEMPQLQAIMGLNRKGDVSVLIQQEIAYLESAAIAKPIILKCKPLSVLLAVKSVLKQNLTLDQYAGLVYIKTRNVNTGTKDAPVWETAMEIQPTCNGLISIARQCGRILDIERPQVTKNAAGQISGVSVRIMLPSHPEPRWEKFEFDEDDFYRWRRASNNENGRGKNDAAGEEHKYANPNYKNFKGGIDPEFARAKAIRHSLKKLGVNQHEVKPGQMIIDMKPFTPIINPEIASEEGVDSNRTEDIIHTEVKNDLPKGEDL